MNSENLNPECRPECSCTQDHSYSVVEQGSLHLHEARERGHGNLRSQIPAQTPDLEPQLLLRAGVLGEQS